MIKKCTKGLNSTCFLPFIPIWLLQIYPRIYHDHNATKQEAVESGLYKINLSLLICSKESLYGKSQYGNYKFFILCSRYNYF